MFILIRCYWVKFIENMVYYYDYEWGVFVYDDLKLF